MEYGCLKDYFDAIGYKRIKPVEICAELSNEHEFNGVNDFRKLFGDNKQSLSAKVIYLCDSEDEFMEEKTNFTWYNARENNPKRDEFRLYYSTSKCIQDKASVGDLFIVCKNKTNEQQDITVFIVKTGDLIEQQIAWLFGLQVKKLSEKGKIEEFSDQELNYFKKSILEKIGIPIQSKDNDDLLEKILARFPDGFPSTIEFSEFARSIDPSVSCHDDADKALVLWMGYEEQAFRLLEKHLLQERLKNGFDDVDDFITFSLSIHNRRKSRAGYALEHHLKHIFDSLNICYSYNKITENTSRPDFIFPDIQRYRNAPKYSTGLTMLGVKTTCKDRWRQVLSEADKITNKHLFTLEPGISVAQTEEMKKSKLKLVVPSQIFDSYTSQQRAWLWDLKRFISLVKKREKNIKIATI